jgi:transcriptional regulator with XRE-family HTH domain
MSSIDKSLTSEQCRGGRGLLNWTQEDLAGRCNVSRATIATFESGAQIARNNHIAIRLALEKGGILFIEQNGGGPGVRLRDPISKFAGND